MHSVWEGSPLASCPGSNYAGEGKRAWYLPFAVVKIFNVNVIGMMIFDAIVTLSSICHVTLRVYKYYKFVAKYIYIFVLRRIAGHLLHFSTIASDGENKA